jgi:hypothetical protein
MVIDRFAEISWAYTQVQTAKVLHKLTMSNSGARGGKILQTCACHMIVASSSLCFTRQKLQCSSLALAPKIPKDGDENSKEAH